MPVHMHIATGHFLLSECEGVAIGHFPLSEYEGVVLQLLVESCYTPGMAPLMQINSEAFQLFVQLLGTSSCTSQSTPPPQELAVLQVFVDDIV